MFLHFIHAIYNILKQSKSYMLYHGIVSLNDRSSAFLVTKAPPRYRVQNDVVIHTLSQSISLLRFRWVSVEYRRNVCRPYIWPNYTISPTWFPWNTGISVTKPPFGVRSCEVAIIWPDIYIYIYLYTVDQILYLVSLMNPLKTSDPQDLWLVQLTTDFVCVGVRGSVLFKIQIRTSP